MLTQDSIREINAEMRAHNLALLKELNPYNPATGEFNRSVVYVTRRDRYLWVAFKGSGWKAHRLAWYLVSGEWPKHEIDHINGDPLDNRYENLRDVTHAENMRNPITRKRMMRRGYTLFRGRYRVVVAGKHVGVFDTPEQALEARAAAFAANY